MPVWDKQHQSCGIPDREIIKIAVKSLGLDDLVPFDPEKRIIEYLLEDEHRKLTKMSLAEFTRETASDSPAPGGGSIAAFVGTLGAALGSMVANLSSHKRGWDHRWEEFSDWAVKGKGYYEALLRLVDKDTEAFNQIMVAFQLPKGNAEQIAIRKSAVQSATRNAIDIPFKVMQLAYNSMEVTELMVEIGNPNSVTDAGVGALCAATAVSGAYLNVLVNASGFDDKESIRQLLDEAENLEIQAKERCNKIQTDVRKKLNLG
jgi:glutamate formiminotransferase/formiminotetrahydrofolate cyclodeaminase